MQIEKQVCSLELAKRLRELGVKQESHFFWVREFRDDLPPFKIQNGRRVDSTDDYSAFTVAELGEMLPHGTTIGKTEDGDFFITYAVVTTEHAERSETEADARGKMLVYLLEQKLITP